LGDEGAGHRSPSGNPLECLGDQRGDIVRQYDPALAGCPFVEDRRIVGA